MCFYSEIVDLVEQLRALSDEKCVHDDVYSCMDNTQATAIFKENLQSLGSDTCLFSDAQIRCLGASEIRHEHVLAKRRVTVDERALAGRDACLVKLVRQYSSAAMQA